jgi:hypothetical protein
MDFVGNDFAHKVRGDSNLLRPVDLDGASLRNSVDRSELDGVSGHLVDFDVSLRELILHDFSGKFILDTVSLLVGVSSHLVVILVLNFNFLESLGGLSGDRVADLVDSPGEVTSALSHLLELDLHDTARNSALNFFKSLDRFAVKVVLRRRSNFGRKLVAEFVFIFERNLSLDRELVLVQLTVSLVALP